ncbi:MAG: hypothetical protein AAGD09_22420 [Cyanobacteria bacterium P01_F01_bin.56]
MMGKQAPKLVVAALIVAALVILAWQNLTPTLALNFLGFQSVMLPLGVWLVAAIALGALTTIAITILADSKLAPAKRANRRQWNVRPDVPPHPDAGRSGDGTSQPRRRGWHVRSPQDFLRRDAANRDDRRQPTREQPRPRPGSPPPSQAVASEDWQVWEQRNKPSAWQDWSDASGNRPADENFDRRQRRDRDKAEATIHDLDKGWDESARDTVYVPPGGSEVQDTLDKIEDGWEDWDSPDNPLADTAYAQKYEGTERASRRDSIYAPPDDTTRDDAVYDADYRVIIPPNRPLEDEEAGGDRPA